jgi:hypothetical protein
MRIGIEDGLMGKGLAHRIGKPTSPSPKLRFTAL